MSVPEMTLPRNHCHAAVPNTSKGASHALLWKLLGCLVISLSLAACTGQPPVADPPLFSSPYSSPHAIQPEFPVEVTATATAEAVLHPSEPTHGPLDAPPSPTPVPTTTPTQTSPPLPAATLTPAPTATHTLIPHHRPTATVTPPPAPRLTSSFPIDGDMGVPAHAAVRLVFDVPMQPEVTSAGLSIEPATEGVIDWESPQELVFTPAAWAADVVYTIRVLSATSVDGGSLADPPLIRFASRPGGPVPLPILMYHSLRDLPEDATAGVREWTVSPQMFAQHLAFLRDNGYNPIPLDQVVDYLEEHHPMPARPLAITFDDGYANFYSMGWRLLQQYGYPATLFVIPSHAGYGAFLTWEQIREMNQAGLDVGSHTLDHVSLRGLAPADLAWQLEESKRQIVEQLDRPVTSLSYAYGSYDENTIVTARAASYRLAVTINPSPYQVRGRPFQLSRVHVTYDAGIDAFAALLPFGLRP